MRTNIAIIKDHSGSMSRLSVAARKDYDNLIQSLKTNAVGPTFLTVVEFSYNSKVVRKNEPLEDVPSYSPIYHAGGGTALYDAINDAINALSLHDVGPDVANLLLIITDGEENASRTMALDLKERIKNLQNTDRWTFTFRVPKGYGSKMIRELGLYAGNLIEWEQTEEALERSSMRTAGATQSYFKARSVGKTSVNTFYANPADVSNKIQTSLDDVSKKFKRHTIQPHQDGISIQDFCIEKIGQYKLGHVYYSLNKTEKVQPNKDIIIRDTVLDAMYAGAQARNLLGLPTVGEIKLAPGNMGKYEVYVRSTSNNRKLYANNNVLVKA